MSGTMSGIRAVIFDLDGTLTQPVLDFDEIRRETGIEGPVLEGLQKLDGEARRRAEAVLERHEREAAVTSRLRRGAAQLLDALRERGMKTAVLTRNSHASVEAVIDRHGLRFDAIRSREDGAPKPDPRCVLDLCSQLEVAPAETLVVGDYLFDLEAANAAGAVSVLLLDGTNAAFAARARRCVRDLGEILSLAGGDFPAGASQGGLEE